MKKREKIFLIIGIILLILILTHFFIFDFKMIANSTYCESEEDCTSYQTTCCSAAINRFHKLFQKEYDMICAVVCPQTITKCEDNKCVLEELEENPNP